MKRHILFITALSGLTLSGLQAGEAPSGKTVCTMCEVEEPWLTYDFADTHYIYRNFDYPGWDEGHGAGANVSKALWGPMYATGSFEWVHANTDGSDADLFGGSAGLGCYFPVTERFHLNVEAAGIWSRTEADFGDDDEFGFSVGPGFRYAVCRSCEVFANVYYYHFDSGEGWDVNVGITCKLTERVALKVGGLLGEDEQSVLVGTRIYF